MLRQNICVGLLLVVAIAVPHCGRGPKTRGISIAESIYLPAAGCENGEAVPNFAIPEQGGAQPACVERGKPGSLAEPTVLSEEDVLMEIGTVILLSLSRRQVIMAADSRSGLLRVSNGQIQFVRVDDQRCKVVDVGASLIFAAAGATKTGESLPGNIYYDSQELARHAGRYFEFDAEWMTPNETVREIAAKWAWDVTFRIRRGFVAGWLRPVGPTWVTGVFAGLEPNGEISVAVARLEYHQQRPGMIVPPVSISIAVPSPPEEFTWIEAFGRAQVAQTYYSSKGTLPETRSEHEHIRALQLRNPRDFPPRVLERLIELTFEKDQARYPDGSRVVGGAIDTARLVRGGRVEWVQRKPACR